VNWESVAGVLVGLAVGFANAAVGFWIGRRRNDEDFFDGFLLASRMYAEDKQ
jgi:hypothetical protein